jgi:T5SS/PEP-CTERM-associated repeat protein/autotransporter-associated beta strand protein
MRAYLLTTTATMALLAATSSTHAQSDWTGLFSSNWFLSGNWVGGFPRQTDDANINTVTPNSTELRDPGALARNLAVGPNGTGTLTIQTGGTLNTSSGTVGNLPGGLGTVTVTGAGSNWSNAAGVVVGGQGTGTLTIQDGGTVTGGGGSVGQSAGSTGTVTVTGPGSSWSNGLSGGLNIGSFGTGSLTIANGGRVINITNFTANIGNGPGSQGTVLVTGAGSTWSNNLGVNIGNSGTGTLTIADSGIVTGPIVVATNAGAIGTLNIGAGAGNPAAAPGTLTAPSLAFGAGTGTLNFNHTSTNYTFAPAISGNGTVNLLAGTTILTANNIYTGTTNVSGGALIVNGSIASSALTTVNSGAALLGSGTVGHTVVNAGGFLVPGPVGVPGAMTVAGNLALQSGAFYVIPRRPRLPM